MIYYTYIDLCMLGEQPMEVHFDHHKGSKGDRETPDEPAGVEIYKMIVNIAGKDIDIFAELSENDNYMDDIALECLEFAQEDRE